MEIFLFTDDALRFSQCHTDYRASYLIKKLMCRPIFSSIIYQNIFDLCIEAIPID